MRAGSGAEGSLHRARPLFFFCLFYLDYEKINFKLNFNIFCLPVWKFEIWNLNIGNFILDIGDYYFYCIS